MNRRQGQAGFTLLEALVAIVIISIGLLGLIGLQTTSLNNTEVSAAMSQASTAAESMADRMRANRAGVIAGDYDDLTTGSIPADHQCLDNSCTAQQVADYDLYEWKLVLAASLPNAVGSVERIDGAGASPPYRFRITISWLPHSAGYQNDDSANGSIAARCSEEAVHCLTNRVTL